MNIGTIIMRKRKSLGFTQQALADKLNVSFQAVSKWENGTSCPEIELLPMLANVLETSVDSLLGYEAIMNSDYENRYKSEDYYWGLEPNQLCYEIMKLKPPTKPLKVLDIGCGEGKDAVFLARNGYVVSALDATDKGIEKGKLLAEKYGVSVDFFKANIEDFRLKEKYDIIFSSGVLHFVKPEYRDDIFQNLKEYTNKNGIHAMNVFVEKPFIASPPDKVQGEDRFRWKSGELFTHYHDWLLHTVNELIFDCNSGGVPHKHCMDIVIAENLEAVF
ncbi:MAG: helix-turn-helix domain-containing protein [Bacillota bacterium]|nr:helix-turn-helix domain-containing protein [Bacillota bacterium]